MKPGNRKWRGFLVLALLLFFGGLLITVAFQQRWLVLFWMNDSQAMWPTIQTGEVLHGRWDTLN